MLSRAVKSGTNVETMVRRVVRPTGGAPLPRIDVQHLLGSGREAVLVNGETEYRLRLTSNGKLILTK